MSEYVTLWQTVGAVGNPIHFPRAAAHRATGETADWRDAREPVNR